MSVFRITDSTANTPLFFDLCALWHCTCRKNRFVRSKRAFTNCRRQWTVLCTCDSTTESARTVIPVRSSREIRGNSSIREGSFTGERAFRENHAIHHESGKLVDASIYRQVSHGPTTGTAHAGIYMRILLRAVSRLIKGKVKAIGVETDFREKLRVRHALSSNDKPSPFPYYSLPMWQNLPSREASFCFTMFRTRCPPFRTIRFTNIH